MKKSLYFGFAALAALAFTACQKEVAVNEPAKKMVTVTLTAQKAGDETRTAAVEGTDKVTYEWTDEDKANLKLVTVAVKDNKEVLTLVENPVATISSDKKTLTITATVEEMSTLRAAISGGWTNDGLKAKVMVNQSPLSNNLDPNADVLVSEDVTVDGLDNALLTFSRPVAINKMTLKNMTPGEKVHEIAITSNNILVGYYEDGKMSAQQGANTITLSYEDVEVGSNGEFPVYFVTMPQEANTLSVVVKSDQFVYSKSFGPVNFSVGKFSKFGVKLPEGEPVVDTDYTGDWVITGVDGDNVIAAQAFSSGNNNLRGVGITLDVENEKIESTKANEIKMHFEKEDEGTYAGLYTIKDASGNYLYAASSEKNYLKGTTTISGADYYWSVEKEPDGTFTIKAIESSNRNLMRFNPNNGSPVFSCYTSGQQPITIYPYSWVAEEQGIQPSGTGTLEDPFNVPAVYKWVKDNLDAGETSDVDYYFVGKISSVKYFFSAEYGTANFNVSADGSTTETQFVCYSVLYLENESWVEGNTQIKVGDEVIVCGKLTNFNGTFETASKKAYVYSLNGVTEEEPAEEYTITISSSENGTVTASAAKAIAGKEITLTVTPATGYELDELTVVDDDDAAVTVTNYKFTMPASNVTVAATFKEKQGDTPDPETLVFSEEYNEDTELDGVTLSGNNYSISFAIGSGTNVPKYFKSGSAARIYGGNTITIDATSGKLTTIVFTCNTANYANTLQGMDFSSGSATVSDSVVTWTGDASSLTITNDGTTQTRISKIVFNY